MRDCIIGKDWKAVVAKSGPTMATHKWYFHYGAYVKDEHIQNIGTEDELTFETISKERLIAGSPEQCLEQLSFWKEEIEPDYIMLRMRQPGGPVQAEALEDIRLFGEKVIGYL